MSQIRAAIYLRISLDAAGDGLAVERQNEDCVAIAKARGWEVVETYTDNSISAYKRDVKRPAYDQMSADYEAGKFEAIICWDLDRLTRQPIQLEEWIAKATDRGLKLVTANGDADLSTDGGRMYARIKASVATSEMERKGERQKRARRQSAEMGKAPSGRTLRGYDKDGNIIPAEAKVVRQTFIDFSNGLTLRALARKMEQTGVETKGGGAWNTSSIRSMLINPRYAGRVVYQGKVIDAKASWKPIIDEATFDLVQSILNDPARQQNKYGFERRHLGSGLFECGVCGHKVITVGKSYWCTEKGHTSRSQAPIERLVIEVMKARLSQPDALKRFSAKDDAVIQQLDEKARELRSRLATIESDYDAGNIDGQRFKSANDVVKAELADIDQQRAKLAGGNALASLFVDGDPAKAFEDADLSVQRSVIRSLATVKLHPNGRGQKVFDPDSVTIEWITGA